MPLPSSAGVCYGILQFNHSARLSSIISPSSLGPFRKCGDSLSLRGFFTPLGVSNKSSLSAQRLLEISSTNSMAPCIVSFSPCLKSRWRLQFPAVFAQVQPEETAYGHCRVPLLAKRNSQKKTADNIFQIFIFKDQAQSQGARSFKRRSMLFPVFSQQMHAAIVKIHRFGQNTMFFPVIG